MVTYVIEANDANFNEIITNNSYVLIDIKAEWCGPCKVISPIIDQLSSDYQGKVVVAKLDADANKETIAILGVRNIPTILFYKNGEIVSKSTGMTSKQKLVEMIESNLEIDLHDENKF